MGVWGFVGWGFWGLGFNLWFVTCFRLRFGVWGLLGCFELGCRFILVGVWVGLFVLDISVVLFIVRLCFLFCWA